MLVDRVMILFFVCFWQTFSNVLLLLKEAFFKHGEEMILKACVKSLAFCGSESQADLQDSAQHMMKVVEDELVLKLRTAIKKAGVSECPSLVF